MINSQLGHLCHQTGSVNLDHLLLCSSGLTIRFLKWFFYPICLSLWIYDRLPCCFSWQKSEIFLVYLWAGCSLTFQALDRTPPPSSMVWKPCNWSSCRYHSLAKWNPELPWVPGHGLLIHSLTVAFISLFFSLTSQISSSFQAQQMQFHPVLLLVFLNLEFLCIWN